MGFLAGRLAAGGLGTWELTEADLGAARPEMRGLAALCMSLLSQHSSSSLSALWGQALRTSASGLRFRWPLWEAPLLGAASVGAGLWAVAWFP